MTEQQTRKRLSDRPIGCLSADVTTDDGDGYGESARTRFAFPANYSDERILSLLDEAGIDTEESRCCHEYDCCGQWYHSAIRIRRSGLSIAIASQGHYVNV